MESSSQKIFRGSQNYLEKTDNKNCIFYTFLGQEIFLYLYRRPKSIITSWLCLKIWAIGSMGQAHNGSKSTFSDTSEYRDCSSGMTPFPVLHVSSCTWKDQLIPLLNSRTSNYSTLIGTVHSKALVFKTSLTICFENSQNDAAFQLLLKTS